MIAAAWGRVPNRAKVGSVTWPLLIVGWAAAFLAGTMLHSHTFVRHTTTRLTVQQQYGQPTQSIPGANVNRALAGFTCDVYRTAQTLICHR